MLHTMYLPPIVFVVATDSSVKTRPSGSLKEVLHLAIFQNGNDASSARNALVSPGATTKLLNCSNVIES
jgi:hypothetical protein